MLKVEETPNLAKRIITGTMLVTDYRLRRSTPPIIDIANAPKNTFLMPSLLYSRPLIR